MMQSKMSSRVSPASSLWKVSAVCSDCFWLNLSMGWQGVRLSGLNMDLNMDLNTVVVRGSLRVFAL